MSSPVPPFITPMMTNEGKHRNAGVCVCVCEVANPGASGAVCVRAQTPASIIKEEIELLLLLLLLLLLEQVAPSHA